MFAAKPNTCPLLRGPCIEAKCKFWTHLLGKNPQGEGVIDKFDCAISFLPVLLVENAQMIRQTAASTDKVATEVRKHHSTFVEALNPESQQRLLDADYSKRLDHQNGSTGE